MKATSESINPSKKLNGTPLMKRVSTWFIINTIALILLMVFHFTVYHQAIKLWPDAYKLWPDVYGIASNFLVGGLVSFFFYYLIVFLPENRRKSIIKSNLQKMYKDIKRDVLWVIVDSNRKGGLHDLDNSSEFLESLTSPTEFKNVFGHDGFHAFANQMSEETAEFKQIINNLTMLSKHIEFMLHNYSIDDQKVFDFYKRLEVTLFNFKTSGAGYDESKLLCRFIWEIYTGWNYIEGNVGHDPIQKMISDL